MIWIVFLLGLGALVMGAGGPGRAPVPPGRAPVPPGRAPVPPGRKVVPRPAVNVMLDLPPWVAVASEHTYGRLNPLTVNRGKSMSVIEIGEGEFLLREKILAADGGVGGQWVERPCIVCFPKIKSRGGWEYLQIGRFPRSAEDVRAMNPNGGELIMMSPDPGSVMPSHNIRSPDGREYYGTVTMWVSPDSTETILAPGIGVDLACAKKEVAFSFEIKYTNGELSGNVSGGGKQTTYQEEIQGSVCGKEKGTKSEWKKFGEACAKQLFGLIGGGETEQ